MLHSAQRSGIPVDMCEGGAAGARSRGRGVTSSERRSESERWRPPAGRRPVPSTGQIRLTPLRPPFITEERIRSDIYTVNPCVECFMPPSTLWCIGPCAASIEPPAAVISTCTHLNTKITNFLPRRKRSGFQILRCFVRPCWAASVHHGSPKKDEKRF